MKRWSLVLTVLGVAALFAPGYWQRHAQTVAAEPTAPRAARRAADGPTFQYVGVSSCAAAACHHKEGVRGTEGCEYTTWIETDPHRNAYAVLFNERSRRIEAAIKQLDDPKRASPEKNDLCLRCHATGTNGEKRGPRLSLADGVGCESCHGPAEKWLSLHYLPDWKAKSPDEKKRAGFAATKDLAVRTEQCAACHVGAAGAEVDHDLIAAGHPRLYFEVGNHHAKLPRHWKEKGDNATPDFEARLWAVGQVISARTALQLLEHRASAGDKVWPEFAEYDCYACHHALREPSTRPASSGLGRKIGTVPWGEWYYSMLPAVEKGIVKTPALDELRKEMLNADPKRTKVADLAGRAADELNEYRRDHADWKTLAAGDRRRWMGQVLAGEKANATIGWDRAAQLYLGLAAHEQFIEGDRLRTSLLDLRKPLRMPKGFDSPTTYDAAAFQRALNEFAKHLEEKE